MLIIIVLFLFSGGFDTHAGDRMDCIDCRFMSFYLSYNYDAEDIPGSSHILALSHGYVGVNAHLFFDTVVDNLDI